MAQYGGSAAKWQEWKEKGLSRIVEAQPNLPSRSTVQVAGLANPGFLVEIDGGQALENIASSYC